MRLNTWPPLLSGAALAFAFALACASVAYADDPGDLDTTFNGTGIVTATVEGSEGAESVAIQPDGKIVVAGEVYSSPKYNFIVMRYRGDGSLDDSFGQGGIVTTSISSGYDGAHAVAIQPDDGKIVAAGMSGRNGAAGSDLAVVRYQGGGSLDPTFNGTGIVTTSIDSSDSAALAVAIQPDNSIVVAGGCGHFAGCRDFAVVRYSSSGSLDPSFNHTGIVTTSIGNSADAVAVALQPDGKIVVAGSGDSAFAVARYTITGSLDTSFNGTGIVTTSILGAGAVGYAAAIQPDGKLVAAGSSRDGSRDSFILVRYGGDGALDTTFNGTGIVTTPICNISAARSVALQPDGKIVAAGYCRNWFDAYSFAVARYNDDGSLDASFNHTGVVTTSIGSLRSSALSVAIQPGDGKIVASGFSESFEGFNFGFTVVRYLGQDSHSYFYYLPLIWRRS